MHAKITKSLPALAVRSNIQSSRKPTVLVLGGYGFIGRYTVKALRDRGARVSIGTRNPGRAGREENEETGVKLHQAVTVGAWADALHNVDAVVNTVGILRERAAESFDQVHHLAVAALAGACAERGIPLVHMSALGIDGAVRNDFSLSKLRGEKALINSGVAGTIVRASVVNAPDGYGSGWLHRVANWPVWLMPAGATRLLSPVDAADLGDALAVLALRACEQAPLMKVLEVGCGEVFTLKEYLLRIRDKNMRRAAPYLVIRVPGVVCKTFARLFDVLDWTPYSTGHHELLELDNVPVVNVLPDVLGRSPVSIAEPGNATSELVYG